MSAQLFDLRPFQGAVKQAKRAGVPPRRAVAEVLEAQREGRPGHEVAGRYRVMAWNRTHGGTTPGGAA
ncbi:MAG: hypothetical protein GX856_08635 [Gammaproteobacteria bacterium]|nr:hypothetical protein [Gammaproteobacteria bacterium]